MFQSSRSEEVGCGRTGAPSGAQGPPVSVLSKRGSGLRARAHASPLRGLWFQSSRSEEVGCGPTRLIPSRRFVVSVLSKRGSGLRGAELLVQQGSLRFSPLEARKWAAGFLWASQRLVVMFQSSRSEEVGCGEQLSREPFAAPEFQSSRSEEVGCGSGSCALASCQVRFSPLEARKWAAGIWTCLH